ncbi:unnamed protein product [Bursaphelenchus xylophilus]|uniref:(pine wood nematode) hypothetical protein n=1 Tax=Bursaphelenchus xylophilus TaxID=6326 RepID=A0A1I7RVE8_BURXY|nr:unnamed protein product [Bursaphelenchus xylophilus]CAG9086746.1 unnamed protein product [Bursaphelenchus xylophilus]
MLFLGMAWAMDDLIAARCQSKCLRELEQRVKDQPNLRKQLRHETLSLCKNDQNCSSCVLPCKEPVDSNQRCAIQVCKSAENRRACEDSCVFLEKISKKKPGNCPKPKLFSADECSAECNRDSDCSETQKCCTVGCSRVCTEPDGLDDGKLLPVPEGISVIERKRKRSAVVRWIMKKMSPQHTQTISNIFVIQWRWGVSKDPAEMTPWQTIIVKNKMYAILKHLLSPGRFYIFRIASVNTYGTAGFSEASLPFKLSKEVKAPSAPSNFTIANETMDPNQNYWTVQLSWTPPASELPIKDYILTWWKSTADGAEIYEKQMIGQKAALVQRKRTVDDEIDDEPEEEDSEAVANTGVDRRSSILPSYTTKHVLDEKLEPGQVYVVELVTNVESTEGELRGEPAILVIRTKDKMVTTTTPVSYDPVGRQSDVEIERLPTKTVQKMMENSLELGMKEDRGRDPKQPTVFRADLQSPYFENGQLRSTVSWLDHSRCTPLNRDFIVRLKSIRCPIQVTSEQLVQECLAPLDDLQFRCDYVVEVRDGSDGELLSRLAFSAPSCASTPSLETIDCSKYDQQAVFGQQALVHGQMVSCLPSNRDETNAVECEWNVGEDKEQIVGYRAVLAASNQPEPRVSIVPANTRRLRFDDLTAGTDYRLQIQAVTTSGLGSEVSTQFRTGAAGVFLLQNINPDQKGLQLEAISSNSVTILVSNTVILLSFGLFLLQRIL